MLVSKYRIISASIVVLQTIVADVAHAQPSGSYTIIISGTFINSITGNQFNMNTSIYLESDENITYSVAGNKLITANIDGATHSYTRTGMSSCFDGATGKMAGSRRTTFPAYFRAKLSGNVLTIHHYFSAPDVDACPRGFTQKESGTSSFKEGFKIELGKECRFSYSGEVIKTGFTNETPRPPARVNGTCEIK
jgi:hypothetical protein